MKIVSASTLQLTARLCLGVAACLSLYLACAALGRVSLPGCESGSDCAKALQSPWAFVFGLPVSFPAFLLYSLTLLKSGPCVRRERSFPELEGLAALAAVATATVWFSCLQMAAVSVFCLWCALVHGFAAVGAACLWAARIKHPAPPSAAKVLDRRWLQRHQMLRRIACGGSAAACVLLLAAGAHSRATQSPGPEDPATAENLSLPAPPPAERGLPLFDGKYHVNPEDLPVIGSDAADAPAAVLLCDYSSAQSRRYLAAVQTLLPSAARPARLIIVPVALTPQHENVQRILIALCLKDRNAWWTLSALITSGQIPAEAKAVERVARKLAGVQDWEDVIDGNVFKIAQQMELAAALLAESRRGRKSSTVPVLIQASRVLCPAGPDMDELTAFIQSDTPQPAPAHASSSGDAGDAAPASDAPAAGPDENISAPALLPKTASQNLAPLPPLPL